MSTENNPGPEPQGEKAPSIPETKEQVLERRKEILESLDLVLAWLAESVKKAQAEEEKKKLQWILDSVQNALKMSRDAEDGKYEVKAGENVQREGVPVDDLLEWLGEEINTLTQEGKAEVVEKLERARQILEKNKQNYWQAHFGKELNEIEWNEETKQKQHWRTEYEANLISQDWRATGNKDSDYQMAEDAMAKRQELVLPALAEQKEETPVAPQEPIKEEPVPETPPVEPQKEEPKKEKEKLVFANISAMIESAAWDAANAKMTEEKEKLGGVKGFFKKIKNIGVRIWKFNWAYEIYKQNEYEKAKKRIYKDYKEGRIDIDKLNIMVAEDETSRQEKHHEAMGAMFDRFASEYDEAVETEAGEEKKKIEDEGVKREVRELIRDYAEGNLSQADLARRHNEILGKIAGPDINAKEEIDNLLEIAERIKRLDSHNRAREALELDLEVIRGRARGGIKTEAGLGRLERIIDRMKKMRGLSWVNETTLALGVTAVYCLGRKISQRFAYSKAANIATFGGTAALSGAYAGILENKRVKEERTQHIRERAKGKTFAPEARRRQEMEQFRYETRGAQDIIKELQNNYDTYEIKGKRKLKDLSEAELEQTLANLADLDARLSLSNEHKIDLIQYSAPQEVEIERTRLLLLRGHIKGDLRNKYPQGFKVNGENKNVNYVDDLTGVRKAELMQGKEGVEGIEKKDKDFNQMKAKRVAKRVGQAAATGLLLGGTFQEIQAALDDDTQSLLEGIIDKNTDARHRTILEGLRDFLTPGKGEAAAEEMSKIMVAGHEVQVGLPKGAELKDPDGDGIYSLFYHNKELCNKVSFDAKGNLTDEARAALAKSGVKMSEVLPKEGQGAADKELVDVLKKDGRAQFIDKHPDLFEKIKRILWYDNDTPKPKFDHNELRLWWGGTDGAGVDQDGNFVFDVQHMTKDGSWHTFSAGNVQRVDAPELVQKGVGGLKVLLSMSRDTQNHVIEILINEHGQAIIPRDSEIAKMLFGLDNKGHAIFRGKFAEVAEMLSKKSQDGRDMVRILATHVGKGVPVAPIGTEPTPIPIFEIPPQTDLPPVIPILGRRPMERMKGPEVVPLIPYYAGYEKIISPEQKKFYLERFSDNLRKNPEVVLDFKEEANLYLKKEKEKNSAYYKDLQEILKQPGMAEPMHDNCRVAVCIPVYDLGEGKIIEHALDQYRKQIKNGSVKADEFELILFLNHPKDKLEAMEIKMGAEERVQTGNPEAYDTEEVIKQYRVKYPELKIRVMKKEFPERPKWGWIIKYDYDAALMRARERKNASDEDIVILTNDVDARDMSDKYLKELISDFDQNKREFEAGESRKIDGIVGRIDHDEETYKMWPNFFVATRFDQFLDAQVRRGFGKEDIDFTEGSFYSYSARGKKGEKHVITQGRNTAIRGSVYSAIGGANTETDAGADTELGRMVTLGRRGVFEDMLDSDRYPFKYNNKVWLNTDPRRELGKYKQGDSIAWAWGDWAKMDVYGKSFKEQIQGEKEDLNKERLEFEFENILKKWNLKSESVIVKRALFWLGFKKDDYHIGEGKVKIDKLENLQTHLNEWMPRRERWQKIKERKGE